MNEAEKQRLLASMRARIQQIETSPQPAVWLRAPVLPPERPRAAQALPGERQRTAPGEVRIQEQLLEPDHHHGAVAVREGDPRGSRAAVQTLPGARAGEDRPASHAAARHRVHAPERRARGAALPDRAGLVRGRVADLAPALSWSGWRTRSRCSSVLRDHVERASCLVTYNGKSYDWPLLLGRFAQLGIPPPRVGAHADLLHAVRRVFAPRLGSVRLVEVEERVLKMRRERDVRGSEIPGVYWSFMRHKVGTAIAPVIEHNANDLVALAAIMAELAARFDKPRTAHDPQDHLAMAKLALRAQDSARAEGFAKAAIEGDKSPQVSVDSALLMADLLKKQGRYREAQQALVAAASHPVDPQRQGAIPAGAGQALRAQAQGPAGRAAVCRSRGRARGRQAAAARSASTPA